MKKLAYKMKLASAAFAAMSCIPLESWAGNPVRASVAGDTAGTNSDRDPTKESDPDGASAAEEDDDAAGDDANKGPANTAATDPDARAPGGTEKPKERPRDSADTQKGKKPSGPGEPGDTPPGATEMPKETAAGGSEKPQATSHGDADKPKGEPQGDADKSAEARQRGSDDTGAKPKTELTSAPKASTAPKQDSAGSSEIEAIKAVEKSVNESESKETKEGLRIFDIVLKKIEELEALQAKTSGGKDKGNSTGKEITAIREKAERVRTQYVLAASIEGHNLAQACEALKTAFECAKDLSSIDVCVVSRLDAADTNPLYTAALLEELLYCKDATGVITDVMTAVIGSIPGQDATVGSLVKPLIGNIDTIINGELAPAEKAPFIEVKARLSELMRWNKKDTSFPDIVAKIGEMIESYNALAETPVRVSSEPIFTKADVNESFLHPARLFALHKLQKTMGPVENVAKIVGGELTRMGREIASKEAELHRMSEAKNSIEISSDAKHQKTKKAARSMLAGAGINALGKQLAVLRGDESGARDISSTIDKMTEEIGETKDSTQNFTNTDSIINNILEWTQEMFEQSENIKKVAMDIESAPIADISDELGKGSLIYTEKTATNDKLTISENRKQALESIRDADDGNRRHKPSATAYAAEEKEGPAGTDQTKIPEGDR
ncbi:hypothetical protein FACS189449_03330 [Alphaproteobacteria bacterium]|nr:hypothetical protein FACS189449_03330 [Alphaproteobacteria bacterium]